MPELLGIQERWGRGGLEDDATLAAAARVLAILGLEPLHATRLAWCATRAWTTHRLLLVVPPDLAHQVAEGLIDVDALLGRSLDELAAE